MIRLAKLTDYAFVVMREFALDGVGCIITAKEISDATELPLPTVSKILKTLSKAGDLEARRGVHGGYQLMTEPQDISALGIVEAFEGPIALTDCISGDTDKCLAKCNCRNGAQWLAINQAIHDAFRKITLTDMLKSKRIGE